uniref:F-box/kelch-repeat protein n=1 Tax=Noccaea caerulescens TaxID=107243 RepID=A0A1J3I6D5_NOCCA
MTPDWSLLPEELLHAISENLDNCFDVVHARSICSSWRSTVPFPSCLLRQSYSLPTFPIEKEGFFTIEKIPMFLFRVRSHSAALAAVASPSEYVLGGIGRRDESDDHITELPRSPPLECSVEFKIPGSESDPTLMNMLDCQIFPLGHHYRMIGEEPKDYRGLAFLPLNKEGGEEGGGEFVVLLSYSNVLMALRSSEMRWMRVTKISKASYSDLVGFRGRFYAVVLDREIVVIDPYSLDVTPLMPSQALRSLKFLVPSGDDDELFLVELIIPPSGVLDFGRFKCRVSRLDDEEEDGKWVEVTDLGDRVLFIGHLGNMCFSAKKLPDGYGLSRNSLLFTNGPGNVSYLYKYGVDTGNVEDDLSFWRLSRENRVTFLSTYPVIAFRVEC